VARREDGAGDWRRLHNEEHHGMYSSPNIVRVIKSRRIRWAGRVARTGQMRSAYGVLEITINAGNYFDELRVHGRLIFKWIFKKSNVGTDWIVLAQDRDRWWALLNTVMDLSGT